MKLPQKLLLIFLLCGVTGCSPVGPEETTGPETPAAPPSAPEDSSGESNFKYGQTAQSSNGWTVSLDSADAAEQITLSNGWTVEVKHE